MLQCLRSYESFIWEVESLKGLVVILGLPWRSTQTPNVRHRYSRLSDKYELCAIREMRESAVSAHVRGFYFPAESLKVLN